ncbi:MAG: T9SS type A sorting domain-containing protein [Bacteroidales bacterium]|nr:T9SS type A sorting domain-containing protein [Bacteroidales bacterium]
MDRLIKHTYYFSRFTRILFSGIVLTVVSTSFLNAQGLIVNSGAKLINRGNLILTTGDLTNNGLVTDSSGTIILTSTTQSINGSSAVAFNNLTLSSGNTTTMSTAGQTLKGILLANGTLNTNAYLTLLSTSSRTALIDGSGTGQVNGSVTMQRYLSVGFGYKYFSSPFQAATVNEFGDDMDLSASFPTFFKYDESRTSSGWVTYTNITGLLNPMEGYAVNFGTDISPNTVDVTGDVNNGSISVTLYNNHNTYTNGFNLIGNPYPSPIDWDALSGWTKTNIDDGIYYFLPSTTDQYGGTYSSYVNGISSDGEATNVIPSMQGIFVHVSDGSYPVTATLGLNNQVRINDLTHPFLKSKQVETRFFIRLAVRFTNDSLSSDPMVIYFDDEANEGFDSKLDALKLINTDLNVPNLYSLIPGGAMLSINALPEMTDTNLFVPLGITTYKSGEISFSIRDIENLPQDIRIYLHDEIADINYDLLPDKEYKININEGTYFNRFTLGFEKTNTTDVHEIESITDIFSVHSLHGIVKTNIGSLKNREGMIYLFDILGHQIFTRKIFEEGLYEFDTQLKPGIYVVTFVTGNIKQSRKIFISNK